MTQHPTPKATAVGPLYFCYSGEHAFTLKAQDHSPWINQGVKLDRDPALPILPFTSAPSAGDYQVFAEAGVAWTVNCPSAASNAGVQPFQIWVQTEYTSPAYKVDGSLGHHRLEFVDIRGNEQFQVIEYQEQATLEAREVSFYNKQLPMPFEAKWMLDGKELGTAIPDTEGQVTPLVFKPTVEGEHAVKLQVPSLYYESGYAFADVMVHALAKTPWNNNATLELNGHPVSDDTQPGLICTRRRSSTLKLVNPDLLLKGSTLTLKSASDLAALDITIADLDVAKPFAGPELQWLINSSTSGGKSGFFELELACSKLKRNWEIAARMISENLADEVSKIEVRGLLVAGLGVVFIQNETDILRLTFEPWMRGLPVKLSNGGTSNPDVEYEPALNTTRNVPDDLKLEWKVKAKTLNPFTLEVICAYTPSPIVLTCRVRTEDILAEFQKAEISGLEIHPYEVQFTEPGLMLHGPGGGERRSIKIVPRPQGSLIGQNIRLEWHSGDLGREPLQIIPELNADFKIKEEGNFWSWIRSPAIKEGLFQLKIVCDGEEIIWPGMSFSKQGFALVEGAHYEGVYYTTRQQIRILGDGVMRQVRVVLNKNSPLFKLLPVLNDQIQLYLSQAGVNLNVVLDPPGGTTGLLDPNGEELVFKIGGVPPPFGSNFLVKVMLPYQIISEGIDFFISRP